MSTRILIYVACLLVLYCGDARSDALSTLFLPSHIEADDGVVSMRADFGGVDSSGRIPVYFVNRTDYPVTLNDGGKLLNIKLEFLDNNGNWVRAEPHYRQSGCIVVSYDFTIYPDQFIVAKGHQRINGEARQVRYRLRTDDFELASNTGQGVVAAVDIERASRDIMAMRDGGIELVSKIALDRTYAVNDHYLEYERFLAIAELGMGRLNLDASRAVLQELATLRPDLRDYVDWAMRRIDVAEAKAKEAEK